MSDNPSTMESNANPIPATDAEETTPGEVEKPEKPPFWQRHPFLFALLVGVSNGFSLIMFVGLESFFVGDWGPIAFCLIVTNGLIWLVKPFNKRFGKKASWKMRLLGVPVLITTLAVWYGLILLFAWFFLKPVTISPQTTFLTEPLAADGSIDYRAEIKRRFHAGHRVAQPEDNGFRLLAACLGQSILDARNEKERTQRWNQIRREMRLDPEREPSCSLLDPETVLDTQPIEAAASRPWTAGEFPVLAAWIADHDRLFDRLGDAVRQPAFVEPLFLPVKEDTFASSFFEHPCYKTLRRLATFLFYRITFRIGEGQTEAAWEDIETLYRLATALRTQSVGEWEFHLDCTFENRANRAMRLFVREAVLDSRQLREYQERRAARVDSISMNDLLLLKRFTALEMMQRIADASFLDDIPPNVPEGQEGREMERRGAFERFILVCNLRYCAWDRHFIAVNRFFDDAAIALEHPGPIKLPHKPTMFRPQIMDKQNEAGFFWEVVKLLSWKGQIGLFPAMMSDMVCGSGFFDEIWDVTTAIHRQVEADDRLTEIAIALEAFRSDHAGRYPAELVRLVDRNAAAEEPHEPYLPRLPTDPFSAEAAPPLYRLEPDGSYILYSRGSNGRDDAGLNYVIDGKKDGDAQNVPKGADDISIRGG